MQMGLTGFKYYKFERTESWTYFALFQALVIPVSFPDVKRALTPTVTAAFVDAAAALGRVKISSFTHKTLLQR